MWLNTRFLATEHQSFSLKCYDGRRTYGHYGKVGTIYLFLPFVLSHTLSFTLTEEGDTFVVMDCFPAEVHLAAHDQTQSLCIILFVLMIGAGSDMIMQS